MNNEDPAWTDYRARFANVYDDCNNSSRLQSYVMRAGHQLLEKQFGAQQRFDRVLEIGAGTGEHVPFVRHQYEQYVLSDVDCAALRVARDKHSASHGPKLSFAVQDASDLSFPDESFDRVIATHVLEHVPQPHTALKKWRGTVKNGGVLSILIPTDPGFAWRLGRRLGPRRRALKLGIAYDYVMAREHVNSCTNLIALLRHYFPNGQEAWWPLRVPSVDLNLFFVFNARVSK